MMWQHNVYYVCVTFSVMRYVGLSPTYLTTLNVLLYCIESALVGV